MSAPQVVSAVASPDWLTAVAIGSLDRRILRDLSTRYFSLALGTHKWRMRNYVGLATSDIPSIDGGLAYGENLASERSILQSWGSLTQKILTELVVAHTMRWTRCDLALSVLYDRELQPVKDWQHTVDPEQVHLSMIVGNGPGGGTLYVGKRGDQGFGRVYDKGNQMGTIPDRLYWRWEVEFKQDAATNVVSELLSRTNPDNRAEWINAQIHGWFEQRGIEAPYVFPGKLQYPMVRYGSKMSTDETTIKWLTQQVSPALRRLDAHGKLETAWKSMGINGSCQMSYDEIGEMVDGRQESFLDRLQIP